MGTRLTPSHRSCSLLQFRKDSKNVTEKELSRKRNNDTRTVTKDLKTVSTKIVQKKLQPYKDTPQTKKLDKVAKVTVMIEMTTI